MDLSRDTIEKKIAAVENEKARIDLLNFYCYKVCLTDIDYMNELLERTFKAASKLGYSRGLAAAGVNKGCYLVAKSKFDEAIPCFEEGLSYFKNPRDSDRKSYCLALNGLGVIYLQKGDYVKSAGYFRDTLNISEGMGDLYFLGTVYDNLSVLHFRLNHKEEALEYAYKALELLKKSGNTGAYVLSCNNVADYLFGFKEFEKSLAYLKEARDLIREKGLRNCLAIILNTTGEVYEAMGKYKPALEYYRNGMIEARREHNKIHVVQLLECMGSVSLSWGKLSKAEKYLKKAFKKARNVNHSASEKLACESLIRLYEQQKAYKKAHKYQKILADLMKKIYDLEVGKKVSNVEADSLKNANQRLKVISAMGHKITSVLNIKEVMDIIYASIHSLMDSPVCGIARYNKGERKIHYEMFIEEDCYLDPVTCDIDDKSSLAAYSIRNGQEIIINDFEQECENYNIESFVEGFGNNPRHVHSMLFIPLTSGGDVEGVLTVQSYKKNAYSLADQDSLRILSSYIVTALNNARQVEKEMEVAKRIQTAILPKDFLNEHFDIYGVMLPADHVGGDYFDFIVDKKKNEWFCIGDVTNHGLTPGLIMMMTQSVIKTIIEMNDPALVTETVINKLNEILYDTIRNRLNIDEAMTISVFRHLGDGKIVTSGLHEDVLIYRKEAESVEVIHTRGMWIGFIPTIEGITKTDEFYLNPGDVMLLYTDGLIEARNEKKELMKLQRIIDLFQQNGEKPPREIATTLLEKVQAFMARQADDITVLVIKKR